MSIAVLIEVYDEVRRLAIAGSAVAPGDFRLKKLIAPLQKSGEKAPVFTRVAQAVQELIESNDNTASPALLGLTTLVNAILCTQAETGASGEFATLETIDLAQQTTQANARILKPLLTALSSTGSGRIELIRDAFERGTFNDLRLVKPAIGALDDPYAEIADFIAEKVLPLYGKAILPDLRAKLDVKGRGGNLHRLRLMHQLDPSGARQAIQLSLSEGSKEMKVAAVECLGTADGDLVFLMEQTRSKIKDVRAAALRALALAGVRADEAVATLKNAIAGDDLDMIAPWVRDCTLPEIKAYVLQQAEQQIVELMKSNDKEQQGKAVDRLRKLVLSLDERSDPGAEGFLLRSFASAATLAKIKSEPSGSDLNEMVAQSLCQGTLKMQKTLAAAYKSLDGGMLPPAIFAARATMSPADFYKEFRPMLIAPAAEKSAKANSPEQARAKTLHDVLISNDNQAPNYRTIRLRDSHPRRDKQPLQELDPRWLDAAVETGTVNLIHKLARPGHAATNNFLSRELSKATKPNESLELLRTMVRVKHPGATDALIESLKKLAKETPTYYLSYWYGPMIVELPKSAHTKFEELLPTLPEKMVDQLMESVMALKNKPE